MAQDDFTTERRLFLATIASVGLAGCSDDGGNGNGGNGNGGNGNGGNGNGGSTQGDVAVGGTYEGTITSGSERDPLYDRLADPVELEGSEGQAIQVDVQSSEFRPYVVLYGPSDVPLENKSIASDGPLSIVLPNDGRYTIWVTSESGDATGSFTLTLSEGSPFVEPNTTAEGETTEEDAAETETTASNESGQDLRSISIGETATGVIDRDDPGDPRYDGLAEPVELTVEQTQSVRISLSSSAFDAQLLLVDPDGTIVAENDDSGATTDSEITANLSKTGAYTIWATSWTASATGEYTLSVVGIDAGSAAQDLRSISIGETARGIIDEEDPSEPQYDGIAEPVEFTGSSGQGVRIRMESSAFDTRLLLVGPDGTVVAENDDAGGATTDSEITLELPADGTYTIWPSSWSGIDTGSYTLSVEAANLQSGPDLRSIAFGETANGFIDETDPSDPEYGDTAEPVEFSGSEGQSVRIEMTSSAFDTYVVLYGPNGYVTEMDDGGSGTNTLLTATLPADGTYTIWAGSLSGSATGEYTLTLSEG